MARQVDRRLVNSPGDGAVLSVGSDNSWPPINAFSQAAGPQGAQKPGHIHPLMQLILK